MWGRACWETDRETEGLVCGVVQTLLLVEMVERQGTSDDNDREILARTD